MKRVLSLSIGNNYATFAGTFDASKLSAGQITIIDADTLALATSSTTRFQFAQFDSDYGARLSPVIDKATVFASQRAAYVAPKPQREVLDFTALTPVIGQNYLFYITALGRKRSVERQRAVYSVVATTTNRVDLINQFVNLINRDVRDYITASAIGNTLALVSKELGFNFGIAFDPTFLPNVTLVAAGSGKLRASEGIGSGTAVRLLEEEAKAYLSYLNRIEYKDEPTFYTVTTPTFVALTAPSTANVTNASATIAGNFSTSGLAVGDLIRITSGTTTDYRVIAINGTTNIVLDRPFEGTTNATLAIANILVAREYDVYTINFGTRGGTQLSRAQVNPLVHIVALRSNAAAKTAFETLLTSIIPLA